MKKILILAVLMTGNVWAGERVILRDSKTMEVTVSNETVLCSALGYGLEELKINIEALDGWTILDHSNIRFGDTRGLPCMTAGHCKRFSRTGGLTVDQVVQNNPRVETIVVNRILTETREESVNVDGEKVCFRGLREDLSTVVGGLPFLHSRFGASEELPANACTF